MRCPGQILTSGPGHRFIARLRIPPIASQIQQNTTLKISPNLSHSTLGSRPHFSQKNVVHKQSTVRYNRCRSPLTCHASAVESFSAGVRRFLDANFIPVAMLSAITIGWLFPGPGTFAAAHNLQTYSTIGIFTISGILLQRGEALAALRSPLALVWGVASILFLTPLAAFPVLRLPLHPPEMALGLAVFCCVPTTLSTCVTLSNACRGNSAVALLLVIVTNVLGVFTIPATLAAVLGSAASSGVTPFEPIPLFISLVKTVLLPLLGGVALQLIVPGLPDWRSRNRKLLSYISTIFLCLVPWMQLSVAATGNLQLTPATVLLSVVAGAVLHLVFLAVNTLVVRFLRFNQDPDQDVAIRKAVVLCTSEKTLPVAVAVINQLAAAGGASAGFAVVPCIMAHLMQISIDSALVSRWNRQDEERAAAAKLAAA